MFHYKHFSVVQTFSLLIAKPLLCSVLMVTIS